MASKKNTWPALQFEDLKDTIYLLHHWTQIIGKVRLKKSPWQNHAWHITLYVESQGLTTGLIPYENGAFEIRMDFIHHEVRIKTSGGSQDRFALGGQTVASFYQQLMEKLNFLGIQVKIHPLPAAMQQRIPFAKNHTKLMYQANAAQKIWKALIYVNREFNSFKSKFTGKSSPVQLYWGKFDLVYTRYSGRKAAPFEGELPAVPNRVVQDFYSHELFSVGFWLGNEAFPIPSFYADCHPHSLQFSQESLQPTDASWNNELGKFILPYELVQQAVNPEIMLRSFLQSAYEAAANIGNWDRESLDGDFSQFDQKN